MKKVKSFILIIIILLMTTLLTGCTQINNNNEDQEGSIRYFVDDTGVTVEVPAQIDRIISLAPSITEILFELGVGDKIVGRDSGSNHPSEAQNIEIVSTYEGVDMEKIVAAEPDIILMDKTLDLSEANYNKFLEQEITVFRVYPRSLQDVLDNIDMLGKITWTELEAKVLVDDLENRVTDVRSRTTLNPKVLHVIYFDGSSSPWVGTTSTFSGDLIEIAGGTAAVSDNSGKTIEFPIEKLIELNPDIILTSQDQTWPTISRESILNDEILEDLNAVKNNQVFDVNADLVDRPGPRIVDGLELISQYVSA